jgi:dienelactone hydrolase
MALRAPVGDPFPYGRGPAGLTNHVEGEENGYVVRLLTMPSAGENGQAGNAITVRYHEHAGGARRPLVVILPIWGGHTYPPSIVAQDLLAEGRVNVMRVLGEKTVIDWDRLGRAADPDAFRLELRRMVERVRTTIVDLRRLLDWAEARPAVDTGRIGLVGFSESTLQVAGLMASEARLAAAVLVMGGAHPHQMLATCYGPPEDMRAQILTRFGWTAAQFAEEAAPIVRPVDAAHLGSRLSPERVLILDAEYDDCVPRSARDALWQVTGAPTRVSVLSTHAGSFLGMTFLGGNHLRHRILDFLGRALR